MRDDGAENVYPFPGEHDGAPRGGPQLLAALVIIMQGLRDIVQAGLVTATYLLAAIGALALLGW